MNQKETTDLIKNKALSIGFDNVGIVKADFLSKYANYFKMWIDEVYNAEMNYMQNNIEKRLNPALLSENAKSVIVVIKNYRPDFEFSQNTYKFSKYALGKDYHNVLKEDLHKLLKFINKEIKQTKSRVFVDSAPLLEKALAVQAGLGWYGKNSLLITKKGSFFFIGEIITDLELDYNQHFDKNYCGSCSKCIESCPTKAITKPYVIDSNKCISYLTIEKKGDFTEKESQDFQNNIFGCDICQDICPWNNKKIFTNDERFKVMEVFKNFLSEDWEQLSLEKFNNIFAHSSVKRAKYEGLQRNINHIKLKK